MQPYLAVASIPFIGYHSWTDIFHYNCFIEMAEANLLSDDGSQNIMDNALQLLGGTNGGSCLLSLLMQIEEYQLSLSKLAIRKYIRLAGNHEGNGYRMPINCTHKFVDIFVSLVVVDRMVASLRTSGDICSSQHIHPGLVSGMEDTLPVDYQRYQMHLGQLCKAFEYMGGMDMSSFAKGSGLVDKGVEDQSVVLLMLSAYFDTTGYVAGVLKNILTVVNLLLILGQVSFSFNHSISETIWSF